MKLAYIAGPYRADTINGTVENIRRAEATAKEYWRSGYAVICPHKNSGLLDGIISDNHFLAGDLEIMRRCDIAVFIPGWQFSEGAKKEHEAAIKWNMQIHYYLPLGKMIKKSGGISDGI